MDENFFFAMHGKNAREKTTRRKQLVRQTSGIGFYENRRRNCSRLLMPSFLYRAAK